MLKEDKENYIESYIGQKCTIYLSDPWYGTVNGTIIKCESGWITLETRWKIELINISRINRISKGK
ncbi:MAG: hypothetical protein L6305_02785 [Actinomycetia bacterium]|nr:hypothetical protein [Actinomycetes bacterium]